MSHRAARPTPQPARTPAAPPDLVQAVVEAIARGELDSELGVLSAVITQRARLLTTAQAVTTLANLRVGDRVRINHHAKPNYLHGQPGTVTGWAGQNVIVQLDQPVGRFTTGQLRCPPLILEPLPPEIVTADDDQPVPRRPASTQQRQDLLVGGVVHRRVRLPEPVAWPGQIAQLAAVTANLGRQVPVIADRVEPAEHPRRHRADLHAIAQELPDHGEDEVHPPLTAHRPHPRAGGNPPVRVGRRVLQPGYERPQLLRRRPAPPSPCTPAQIQRQGARIGGSGAFGRIPTEPELIQVGVGLDDHCETLVQDRPIDSARRQPDRERLHLHPQVRHEGRNLSRLVHLVHATPTKRVGDLLEERLHATVHYAQATPRKCEEYREREVDEIEWLGHRVYLHLGICRDHPDDHAPGRD